MWVVPSSGPALSVLFCRLLINIQHGQTLTHAKDKNRTYASEHRDRALRWLTLILMMRKSSQDGKSPFCFPCCWTSALSWHRTRDSGQHRQATLESHVFRIPALNYRETRERCKSKQRGGAVTRPQRRRPFPQAFRVLTVFLCVNKSGRDRPSPGVLVFPGPVCSQGLVAVWCPGGLARLSQGVSLRWPLCWVGVRSLG